MGSSLTYADLSLWQATCGEDLVARPALPGAIDVDVAIVGAGFTGLWTAYYLSELDPSLRIAVVEKHIAGFGASGRNGGWVSGLFPASRARLARLPGSSPAGAIALTSQLRATIDEIRRVSAEEGIDCDFTKGGTIVFARTASQLARARAEVEEARSWGDTEDDVRLLDAGESREWARAARRARGDVHAPLRSDPASHVGARARRSRRTSRRRPLRTDSSDRHRAAAGEHCRRRRHGRGRPAGHRGIHG